MRVLHVVTLVSPDGAYGGPIRVAVNQCRSLAEAGHTVALLGGHRGHHQVPTEVDGVPAHLFRTRRLLPNRFGFAGMAAPGTIAWLLRHRADFDVVHVHLARDLVTLPIARLAITLGQPVIVQTHGMIVERHDVAARVVDTALTRRVLSAAAASLYLTEVEHTHIARVSRGRSQPVQLPNGVPSARPRAETASLLPEVLFLARLHPRKRAVQFAEAAITLLDAGIEATFTIVGPDEGDGPTVRGLIERSRHRDSLTWTGPLAPEATLARMSSADIFALPSIDEPFPMAVLEAMSVGLPVIVTTSCGIAATVRDSSSGLVVEPTTDALVEAMRRLIVDVGLRERMGSAAHDTARREFSLDAVRQRLESLYDDTVCRHYPPVIT